MVTRPGPATNAASQSIPHFPGATRSTPRGSAIVLTHADTGIHPGDRPSGADQPRAAWTTPRQVMRAIPSPVERAALGPAMAY
jgi:hypothetical protein